MGAGGGGWSPKKFFSPFGPWAQAQFGLKMKWGGEGGCSALLVSVSQILNSVLWSGKIYNHFHSIIIFLEIINFQLELYYMYM